MERIGTTLGCGLARPTKTTALKFIFFFLYLVGLQVKGAALRDVESQLPSKPRKYLYPVLIFGPNNQVTGFKEMLVLGHLLRRTVIVHDIKMYLPLNDSAHEARSERHFVEFDQMYDYAHTASRRDVVHLAQRLLAGWGGKLDAVVYFTQHWLPYWRRNLSARVAVADTTKWIDYGVEHIDCSTEGIADLAKLVEPYETVGFIMFKNLVWDAGYGVIPRASSVKPNMCLDEYIKANGDVIKSAKVKAIADSFRHEHFAGGKTDRYMAVHVRPYPDTCIMLWRRSAGAELPVDPANRDCHNPSLMRVLANQTLAAIKRHKMPNTIFIMCHPVLRDVVRQLYSAVGVSTIFFEDAAAVVSQFGASCPSMLGMVEQEIVAQADVFLATKASSMSGIVVEERYAVNKAGQVTLFIEGDMAKLSWAIAPPS